MALVGVMLGLAGASACTWAPLEPGAQQVGILSENAAQACKRIGKTRATTASKVLFVPRGKERVTDELERLARNAAAEAGGDAVAPLGPVVNGAREFGIYRCAPTTVEGSSE